MINHIYNSNDIRSPFCHNNVITLMYDVCNVSKPFIFLSCSVLQQIICTLTIVTVISGHMFLIVPALKDLKGQPDIQRI